MKTRRGAWLDALFAALSVACFSFVGWHSRAHPEPFDPGSKDEGVLRVVTWNLGIDLESGGSGLSEERLTEVARILRELEPDLVLVQELESNRQLSRLRKALGAGWKDEISPGLGSRRVAVLVRSGRLIIHPLPDRDPRALLVRWETEAGLQVAVACVHADAFSSRERNQTIGGLVDALHEMRADHHLLGGDLNLDLDLDIRRDLFTDDEYLDVETYNYVARNLLDAGRGQGATAEPDRRIDYLFVDPGLAVQDAGPVVGRRVGSMDHDPLVADLLPSVP